MKASFGEKVFYIINYIVLGLWGISCVLPLINMAAVSLSDNTAIASGSVFLWPVGLNIESYKIFFEGKQAFTAIKNSVIYTIVSVVFHVSCTVLAAYPLSRKYFIGRRYITLLIVFTMLFGGGAIPHYLLIQKLGLLNTYWSMWLPGAIGTYNLLIMKSSFEGIPEELFESARIDGCSELGMLFKIVLPLSGAVIATITLFASIGAWNNFGGMLMYITDTSKHNLPVMVQQLIQTQRFMQQITNSIDMEAEALSKLTPDSVRAAGVFILIVPMLAVYPFMQKHFVKGVLIGSVKG